MAPPRVGWRGRSFAIRLLGATHNVPLSPLGLCRGSSRREAVPGPCAEGPRVSSATCGGRCGFRPKRVPAVSQRLEGDAVSLAPGVSLYPFSFWRPRRRRCGKRGGKALTGLPRAGGGAAQGALRARSAGRKPGDDPFPSTCCGGASSPGNPPSCSQPGEQRVWEARSGSESGGGGARGGGRWGQGRAPACTSSLGRRTGSSTQPAPAPRGGCFSRQMGAGSLPSGGPRALSPPRVPTPSGDEGCRARCALAREEPRGSSAPCRCQAPPQPGAPRLLRWNHPDSPISIANVGGGG